MIHSHFSSNFLKSDAFVNKVIDIKITVLHRVDYPNISASTKKREFDFMSPNNKLK